VVRLASRSALGGRVGLPTIRATCFPATAEVIRQLRPRAFIVENVKGLTRSTFANYFAYIQLRLQHPEIVSRPDESWGDHHARLQAEHTTVSSDLRYNLVTTLVNAADYGVPQQRHRVFMVGFRADLEAEWQFPEPTHSYDQLMHDQYVTGAYWEHNRVKAPQRSRVAPPLIASQRRLEQQGDRRAWRTVPEALADLPTPTTRGSRTYLNHLLQPGARQYPGHTGSPVDLPAKALKAGGHGVPGGENMALFPDGTVRYFSVRESARLQTFPDRWEFHGAWGEAMRQLGNAVPVLLAEKVARSVHEHLALAVHREQTGRIVASRRALA
jgi:DNA (cytosine-5)-methyltransferase 1